MYTKYKEIFFKVISPDEIYLRTVEVNKHVVAQIVYQKLIDIAKILDPKQSHPEIVQLANTFQQYRTQFITDEVF